MTTSAQEMALAVSGRVAPINHVVTRD